MLSNYLATQLAAHLYRSATFPKPGACHIGLLRANRGYWSADTGWALNDYVIPVTPNGRIYRCSTAGTGGSAEPTWPTTDGGTVADGAAVWTETRLELRAGTLPEPVGVGAYARVQRDPGDAAWSAVTSGRVENAAVITFPAPTANWGVVWGVFSTDAASGGNLWHIGALTTPQTVNNGNPAPTFSAGELDFLFS